MEAIRLMSEKARARRGGVWGKGTRRSQIASTGRSPKWMTGSQMWTGQSRSSCKAPCEGSDRMNLHPQEMAREQTDMSREEIGVCLEELDERGAHRPIKDGLEDDGVEHVTTAEDKDGKTHPDDEGDTSEEEREMPGTRRPRRGSGWWGIGRPLQPHCKGINKDFVDGAGILSPGRWKIKDRPLP